MYTHLTEYHIKPGTTETLRTYFETKCIPVLRKADGFVEITMLNYVEEPERFVTISFWTTKELCTKFVNETFPTFITPIREHLTTAPVEHYLNVEYTTMTKKVAEAA